MNLNLLLFMSSEPLWEHLSHGLILGCLIALLVWKRGWIKLNVMRRIAWTRLTNATMSATTNSLARLTASRAFTKANRLVLSLILVAAIIGTLSYNAGYGRGFNKGFVAGIAEVHSWTTTYYGVTVTWQDATDPLHYEFDLHDKDGKSLGRFRQSVCREGSPSYYPSFQVGDYMDYITFENKGKCWSFATPDTNWPTPKIAKFIIGVTP